MKTILVPTDFSKNATNALNYAAGLINQIGGELIMVHFIELPVTPLDGAMIVTPVAQLAEEYHQELTQQADTLAKQFSGNIKIKAQCRFGDLLTNLNILIKNYNIDLVVMGTKGASNVLYKLVGTNTADFIKIANCPVLAVPDKAQFTGINQIAYASDFESEESIFLQQLFAFAEPLQAEVAIINIIPERHLNIFSDNHVLREIKLQYADKKYSIAQIQEGDVLTGINEFVAETHPDVLAVSIHARSFLEDIFHKSISKSLFYQVQLPLLALPERTYWQSVFKPVTQAQNPLVK
ncbi:universal stress protein [Adhaeribacter rhizoryzae]|uniref:Universal stress protein n=1 Tax=Adhaeribacter rhizoryzae TaxID=2607907 RepID=A0A5M6D0X8_9BACT|nr:universal stress protein [Adhaeribacter rhizoryzae]KAA5539942.1 universal stress protein [Adhaeribacter rhizoryzae]